MVEDLLSLAAQIHQDARQMIPVQVQSDGIAALRVDLQFNGGLAPPPAAPPARLQGAVIQKLVHDVRDRLRRQRRVRADLGPRQWPEDPDRLQHDPLVVEMGRLDVGTGQDVGYGTPRLLPSPQAP